MADRICTKDLELFFYGMHVKHRYGLAANCCPICESDKFVEKWK